MPSPPPPMGLRSARHPSITLSALLVAALVIVLTSMSRGAAQSEGSAVVGPAAMSADERTGRAADHTWLFGKKPIGWQTCGALTYRVNPAEAPTGWKATVRGALRRATQASGIRFRYVGTSSDVVTSGSQNPAGTEVMIAFLDAAQTDMLGSRLNAGQGGASSDGERLFNGKVVLNGPLLSKMEKGFGSGPRSGIQGTQGQIVMHEVGHMLGLGHAKARAEIMYAAATRKPAEWGAGDYRGLQILGREACDRRAGRTGPSPAPTSAGSAFRH